MRALSLKPPAVPEPPASLGPKADAGLVRAVLEGDVTAFEALMRRYNQRVFRAARAVLGDESEAEDAAQQAWISIYCHLHQWDARGAFSTWALRIVVHEAIRRSAARGRPPLLLVEAAEGPPSAPSPEDEAHKAELRALLERAVDALPQRLRVVLVLRDIEELSGPETAATLGLTEEAVRVRLHRARRTLREALDAQLDAATSEVFPFLGARCDAIVAGVLAALPPLRSS
jgi:RNA polymerase sigma-70 factor (ECF subfamily)